ncbi:hypothetical protein [Aporhodopirellula aestuarii]|uniref:Uncharacterized protein n=1 Tax=Aporhodopirellula aestuarii TaxID=2950107 RepID=A0ABT0U5W2_9BACT|nr:hypothetical protein [Aporhodopirellula aestuarii]MCM2372322.1 hypothetical protein [Aporhodopirellula aestuarii]
MNSKLADAHHNHDQLTSTTKKHTIREQQLVMIQRVILPTAVFVALAAFGAAIYSTPNLVGVALGASLMFVILALGYLASWIVNYLQAKK